MPSKQILLAAALAAVAPTATVLAQGSGTTINNVNNIANANTNENTVDVSVNVGGGVVAPRPTTLSTRTLTPPSYTTAANSTTTTVVTAWSTYCPEPTVFWFEKERYVVTKPTMVTYKNCPCTITTKVPVYTNPPVRPAVVPAVQPHSLTSALTYNAYRSPIDNVLPPGGLVGGSRVHSEHGPLRCEAISQDAHYVVPTVRPAAETTTVPVTAGAAGAFARGARGLFGLAVAVAVGAFAL
ncbi:hypothetical protein MAPG_05226 [Magnaporthiopsis poae ATCC 64411]|uniref:Mmc protein n=1 Tax=Magnaporthiopsis poae (strain ATCC 64411 / 73-15) TaxID=644358 RepID=A0A0C4DYU7_MAGP6|nr:hypothetical protein MAPG_05226 [Magnaporthiopsis poae ATCC 64411]